MIWYVLKKFLEMCKKRKKKMEKFLIKHAKLIYLWHRGHFNRETKKNSVFFLALTKSNVCIVHAKTTFNYIYRNVCVWVVVSIQIIYVFTTYVSFSLLFSSLKWASFISFCYSNVNVSSSFSLSFFASIHWMRVHGVSHIFVFILLATQRWAILLESVAYIICGRVYSILFWQKE